MGEQRDGRVVLGLGWATAALLAATALALLAATLPL